VGLSGVDVARVDSLDAVAGPSSGSSRAPGISPTSAWLCRSTGTRSRQEARAREDDGSVLLGDRLGGRRLV